MKKNNIGYLLREGFRGVFLHGFMSFAAICVTAVSYTHLTLPTTVPV